MASIDTWTMVQLRAECAALGITPGRGKVETVTRIMEARAKRTQPFERDANGRQVVPEPGPVTLYRGESEALPLADTIMGAGVPCACDGDCTGETGCTQQPEEARRQAITGGRARMSRMSRMARMLLDCTALCGTLAPLTHPGADTRLSGPVLAQMAWNCGRQARVQHIQRGGK